MWSLFYLLVLISLIFLLTRTRDHSKAPQSAGNFTVGSVFINGTVPIAQIDDDFICATLDWGPPGGTTSLLNLDLNNKILRNAVTAFSPLKIRLGGTLQDDAIYEESVGQGQPPCLPFVKNQSQMFGFNQGCLPLSRWDDLNTFFNETGVVATFGLNALIGRRINPNGLVVGAWDSNNAESLIRYTISKGYNIVGWELGNELSGKGVGTRISAHQYALDVSSLRGLLEEIDTRSQTMHQVIAPGGFFNASWFTQFIDQATNSVQVITHHVYNLGPGSDDDLVEKILDPSYLDGESIVFSNLQRIIRNSGTSAVAWVGEAGGAFHGGHKLVTDAFVMNFWYLDQLGMAASYDTKTYCRQTLIGANYGLLNTTSFAPNPDYYSALLWHRLMGTQVLSTAASGTKKLRAYAHCSRQSDGIALLLLNLDGNATVQVGISTESGLITSQNERKSYSSKFSGNTRRFNLPGIIPGIHGRKRKEYHFTAQDGNLHSQTVLLNGKVLSVSSSGEIPPLEPAILSTIEEHQAAALRATARMIEVNQQPVMIAGIPRGQGMLTTVESFPQQLMFSWGISNPIVPTQSCHEKGYSVVTVEWKDRPQPLFDTICTLMEIECPIFHGFICLSKALHFRNILFEMWMGAPLKHRVTSTESSSNA
ncbi:hypothetical protein Nepgr_000821 [Nepenthes gracilis]|uniref:Heparanase-like protein 3 n=1 Tax=Nepenthes gracilis TaxID=150966 RepID=A0AAD3RVQ1_NEPGR|nr:hypothetical protein Nepgr_000821 [Nepenthes gracilis]